MFYNRGKINKINRLHERYCLAPTLSKKMIPQNRKSRYELQNNTDFTIGEINSPRRKITWVQKIGKFNRLR